MKAYFYCPLEENDIDHAVIDPTFWAALGFRHGMVALAEYLTYDGGNIECFFETMTLVESEGLPFTVRGAKAAIAAIEALPKDKHPRFYCRCLIEHFHHTHDHTRYCPDCTCGLLGVK